MTNVLLIYERLIPSVRLCAYEQLNYLMTIGKINFKHCTSKDITKEMCAEADVVFFVRSASILEEGLAKQFKKQNKLLIYVLDDDLLNVPEGLSSSEYYRQDSVKKRIRNIMSCCEILLTPSLVLKDKYGKLFEKTVVIEEPCISYQRMRKEKNKTIKIGFAGSIDRAGDFDTIISDVIRLLLAKYDKNISFEFMGAKPKIVDELALVHYEYEDNYIEYKKLLDNVNWDIGLAPLPDTEFHRCKHYNKFIEYSSSSIVGVYSNVEPYSRIIRNRSNGVLCDNTLESWINEITWLIDNNNERREISRECNKLMKDYFDISIISQRLFEVIPELSNYKSKRLHNFPLNRIKLSGFLEKCVEFIRVHGIKSPLILINKLKAFNAI